MTKWLFGLGTALLVGIQPLSHAAILELDAHKLFEQSVTDNVRLSHGGREIQLESGELFEDDGPASGHSYQQPENREQLTAQTWIRKELIIPNPQARGAWLVVLSDESPEVVINGSPQKLGENQSGRKLHKTYAFSPNLLRVGTNEIILKSTGKVWIAR